MEHPSLLKTVNLADACLKVMPEHCKLCLIDMLQHTLHLL